jgi:hypothetical protein
VHELVEHRRHRVEPIGESLDPEMCAVVLLGTLATIALGWLMPGRSRRLHFVLEVLLGTFLALSLFSVVAFDRPLFGDVSVDARPYELVRDRVIGVDPP